MRRGVDRTLPRNLPGQLGKRQFFVQVSIHAACSPVEVKFCAIWHIGYAEKECPEATGPIHSCSSDICKAIHTLDDDD